MTSSWFAGAAYVVFGGDNRISQLSVKMTCAPWQFCGYSVSGAGDINRDGLSDVLVGSVPSRGTNNLFEQQTYVIF
eukprot:gene34641-42730_t